MSEALGTANIVLVDTNVFVAVGNPDRDKYQALRAVVQREGVLLQVPERVEAELRTMQMSNRVETAVEDGWAELVDPPEPTDSDAVTVLRLSDVIDDEIGDNFRMIWASPDGIPE